jgi:hypothetical protein
MGTALEAHTQASGSNETKQSATCHLEQAQRVSDLNPAKPQKAKNISRLRSK